MTRKNLILILIFLFIIGISGYYIFFSILLEETGGREISVIKLNEKPKIFVQMNNQHINQFPSLEKAINVSGERINISYNEYQAIYNFFFSRNTNILNFEYRNYYYHIIFYSF